MQKPHHFASQYAESFQDRGVVEAYRYRPPYPAEIFDILAGLISRKPRHVLDIGCGTGNIARQLVSRVERLDAVDVSRPMIEHGKQLPNGDHPRLRWMHGRVEDAAFDPPYALVTAGESLHWMDWQIVLPRCHRLLAPGDYLAIVTHDTVPDPWSTLGEIVPRYRMDGGYQPFNMIEHLEQHGLFRGVGEKQVGPSPFMQSIADYIESFHSRSGFSRERMGPDRASAFDREAREILLGSYAAGIISLEVSGSVVWGFPTNASGT
jgi:SAM-dependent methyltransferase